MDLQLFSIEHAPRAVPAWELILEDLGKPTPDRIARALGIGRSTVYRWSQHDQAPRVACLALFWLTRWGHSLIHTQATNSAILAAQLARSLAEDRAALQRRLNQATRGQAEALAEGHAPALPAIDWPPLEGPIDGHEQASTTTRRTWENDRASDLLELRQGQPYRAACGQPNSPAPRAGLVPSPNPGPARLAPRQASGPVKSAGLQGAHGPPRRPPWASREQPSGPPTSLPLADQAATRPGTPASAPPPVGDLSGAAAPAPTSAAPCMEPGQRVFTALVQATTRPPQRSKR